MTKDIEAREKRATPGPWFASTVLHLALAADVEFAMHAREDIPYLLAQLRDRGEENARLTLGFEQLRQSLTVMQPEYEALKEKLEAEEKWREAKHACPVDYCCWSAALVNRDRILKGGD